MKWSHILVAYCLPLLLVACAPSPEQRLAAATTVAIPTVPAPTVTPIRTLTSGPSNPPGVNQTATIESTRFFAEDKTYSLVLPSAWVTGEYNSRPAIFDPQHVSVVYFWEVSGSYPFESYAGNLKDHIMQQFKVIKQIPGELLVTDEGQDYYRSGIEYTSGQENVHQIFYIYSSGGWTLIITYSRPVSQVAEYDALVDTAMKTLRYNHK